MQVLGAVRTQSGSCDRVLTMRLNHWMLCIQLVGTVLLCEIVVIGVLSYDSTIWRSTLYLHREFLIFFVLFLPFDQVPTTKFPLPKCDRILLVLCNKIEHFLVFIGSVHSSTFVHSIHIFPQNGDQNMHLVCGRHCREVAEHIVVSEKYSLAVTCWY